MVRALGVLLVRLLALSSAVQSDDCSVCNEVRSGDDQSGQRYVSVDCRPSFSSSVSTKRLTTVPTRCIPLDVTHITLNNNDLTELRPYEFSNFTKLEDINLIYNLISVVNETAFHGLDNLRSIKLEYNKLTEFPRIAAKKISLLALQGNSIRQVQRQHLDELTALMHLDLKGNQISSISNFTFVDACSLEFLSLGLNPLQRIGDYGFVGTSLEKLDIRGTSLEHLPTAGLHKLRVINATGTRSLKSFPPHSSLPSIRELSITYQSHCCLYATKAYPIQDSCSPTAASVGGSLHAIINEERSETASKNCRSGPTCIRSASHYFPLCFNQTTGTTVDGHYIPACWELENVTATPALVLAPTIATSNITPVFALPISCTPQPNDFNSCDDVMGNWLLRILVWVVIVVNIVGNVTVITVFLANYKRFNAVKLLLCNMAFADVCMSAYLITLAMVDAVTYGKYADHAIAWKTGGGCQAIGFVSVFSSILSLYSLTALTLERFHTIHYSMYGRKIGFKHALVFVLIGWIYALIMATMPLVGVSDYTVTAICLPFDLSDGGRAYIIFGLVVNLLAFCIIAGVYVYLFLSLAGHGPIPSRRRDMHVLFKMMILVVVDFCCWMPIIILGLISASSEDVAVSLLAAKYVMVFIYPLNSCANPFLYAIFTKPFKRDFFEFWYRFGYFEKQYMEYARPASLRRSRTRSSTSSSLHMRYNSRHPSLDTNPRTDASMLDGSHKGIESTDIDKVMAQTHGKERGMKKSVSFDEGSDTNHKMMAKTHGNSKERGIKKSVSFDEGSDANHNTQQSVNQGSPATPSIPIETGTKTLMNGTPLPEETESSNVTT